MNQKIGKLTDNFTKSRVEALIKNRDLPVDGILEYLACDVVIDASEECPGSSILINRGVDVARHNRSFVDKVTQRAFPRREVSITRVSKGSHSNDFISIAREMLDYYHMKNPEVADALSRRPWKYHLSLVQAGNIVDLVFQSVETKSERHEDRAFGGRINFEVYHPILILVKADCHIGNNGDSPVSRSMILEFRLTDKHEGTFLFHRLDSPINWGPGATVVMANV